MSLTAINTMSAMVVAITTLAACTHTGASASGGACKPGDPALAGHYYLNGVMEVGSELLLRPDGSFEFMLVYGANDQYGKGCWTRDGRMVSIIPAGQSRPGSRHTPDSPGFTGMTLTVDGGDLVWDIAGSGHKGRYEKG